MGRARGLGAGLCVNKIMSANIYYTPRVAALAASVRSELKLDNTPNDWLYTDRQQYNNILASRLAARPELYGRASEVAGKYKPGGSNSNLQEYGFAQIVGDFTGEFVSQGQKINPFSEQNRRETKWILVLSMLAVAIGGVIYLRSTFIKV